MAKNTLLQSEVDELIQLVEAAGKLVKDKNVTANIFQIIENTESIKTTYNLLATNYSGAWKINNMIGKRSLFRYKAIRGKSRSTKNKTSLAKSYSLLYENEQERQNDEKK